MIQSFFLLLYVAATTALRLGAAPTVRAAATKNCAAQMGANKGALLFDCDGVIWKGDSLIDKVPSVLELLRKLGKKIFFVTNNSTKSRKGYKGKFEKLGLDVEPEEIFSSSFAAAALRHDTK